MLRLPQFSIAQMLAVNETLAKPFWRTSFGYKPDAQAKESTGVSSLCEKYGFAPFIIHYSERRPGTRHLL